MTMEAIKDRVSLCTTESENIDILGSRERLDWCCKVNGDLSNESHSITFGKWRGGY